MSSGDVKDAQNKFMQLLGSLPSDSDRLVLLKWVQEDVMGKLPAGYGEELPAETILTGRGTLHAIAVSIKQLVPTIEATFPTERFHFPEKFAADGDEGMTKNNTIHVDGFLYDEEEEERLVQKGKLPRSFCLDCGSRNTREFHYISHSCSKEALEIIFLSLLPPLAPTSVVLDVGSRLGAVLYGAHFYTRAECIIGVELNKQFCELQQRVVKQFGMLERVTVHHADISNRRDLLQAANVVILNNVFEFFVEDKTVHVSLWKCLIENLKPGTLIVTIPALKRSLDALAAPFEIESWVEELPPFRTVSKSTLKIEDESAEIHLYRVLQDEIKISI